MISATLPDRPGFPPRAGRQLGVRHGHALLSGYRVRWSLLFPVIAWVLFPCLSAEEDSSCPALTIAKTGASVEVSWRGDSRWVLQKADPVVFQHLGGMAFHDVDRAEIRSLEAGHEYVEPAGESGFFRLADYGRILPEAGKANILILHGKGMYDWWMERTPLCEELENVLGDRARFFYAQAPHNNPFLNVIGREWWNCLSANYQDLEESVDYVIDYANDRIPGDIDLVIGYSQGGALASYLFNLLDSGRDLGNLAKVRNAIFINSAAMRDITPQYDRVGLENRPDDYSASNMNTLHLIAESDTIVKPRWSVGLAESYRKSVTITYAGDHFMASGGINPLFVVDLFPDTVKRAVEDWIREN